MTMTRSAGGLVLLLGAAGCFPEVAYEADKIGIVDPDSGGLGGDDGGGSGGSGGGSGGDGDTCQRYADEDGDGYGAGEPLAVDCEADGYVISGDDCDDGNAEIHPAASERCNSVDDDCDGTTDEDLVYDWYADTDSDGFGAGASLDDCDPPAGSVDNDLDCDDLNADVFPDAPEVCNELDDDCDGDIDDADANLDLTSATTWHHDSDGDGYGSVSDTTLSCEPPDSTFIADGTDCDDSNAAYNPGATEVCDGEDNDCDFAIDDADASLDPTSATEWHHDRDSDGFGAAAVGATTCIAPSGMVVDDRDCDDGDAEIHPGADEVCNGVDDDCDALTDDRDPDLDTSTGTAFHTDADGDGYGDASTAVAACVNPGGLVVDATDCDDSTSAIHPGATEVCNALDDDCDALIDDADPSLDLSTTSTWYEDADGDGLGVSSTVQACDQPSGYTDNADDCDDSGFDDYDGDLLQDCEDSDADGDGLSETYDADDLDDSIVRGPTGGFGTDGPLSLSGTTGWTDGEDFTLLGADATAGDTNIAVDDVSVFAVGDEVLVVDLQGADAGDFGFYYVTAVSGSTLELEPPVTVDHDADDVVVVQRVPHYTTATVSGTLSPAAWDGEGGGLVVFRATGAVTVSGSIDVSGLGYLGGRGVSGNSYNPTSGGTWSGGPASASTYGVAVDGGGGAVISYEDLSACGGGGAYGTDGGAGDYMWGSNTYSAGASYGDSALSQWFFGSGGGGGAPDDESDGNHSGNRSGAGGAGGGLIAVYSADSITVSGSVLADGEAGEAASFSSAYYWNQGENGGGGAGAGGQVLLVADTLSLSGKVSAEGGSGGVWATDTTSTKGYGGDGGDGRTRLEYTSVSGVSAVSPVPTAGTYVD